MQIIENQTYDEERALYGSRGIEAIGCCFDGPADGESASKESSDISVKECFFNLRYPFWHDRKLLISNSEMTENCRAALWYSEDIDITDTTLHGIKALRECADVRISGCDIISPEFGWSVRGIRMTDSTVESEYFMMRSDHLTFDHVKLKGKYSFQYIEDSVFTNCEFDTKDALWHARNVVVKDSVIKGEYLGWYCENVTFENCTVIGTQPLCYCKGLKLTACRMVDCDLAFEKSDVEADIISSVDSIKNPLSGRISALSVEKMIMDDSNAQALVFAGD